MGYNGLENAVDSDNAADIVFCIEKSIKSLLSKELRSRQTEFNTDGPVSVALVFQDHIIPGGFYGDDMIELANDTIDGLDDLIDDIGSVDDWGGNTGNRQYHLSCYKRLRKMLKKYIKENE